MSVLTGVDPNADNFVSAGIVNTRSTLIGCLLRLEPNKETKVRYTLLLQWRRKMFFCRGAESTRTWCTMVVRQVDYAHNDIGGSGGMLPQENFSFLCVSKSILVHSKSIY